MPISRIHWWCGVSSPEIRPLQLTETDIVGWFELIPAIGLKTLLCIRAQGFSQLRTSIQEVGSKCQNGLCTFCPRNPSPQGPRDLATPRLEGAVLTVWCQTKRFQILPSPLGGCVTLGESLNFSETLQFPLFEIQTQPNMSLTLWQVFNTTWWKPLWQADINCSQKVAGVRRGRGVVFLSHLLLPLRRSLPTEVFTYLLPSPPLGLPQMSFPGCLI